SATATAGRPAAGSAKATAGSGAAATGAGKISRSAPEARCAATSRDPSSPFRRRAIGARNGGGEALGEVGRGAGLRGVELEIRERGRGGQLGEQLVDLAVGQ